MYRALDAQSDRRKRESEIKKINFKDLDTEHLIATISFFSESLAREAAIRLSVDCEDTQDGYVLEFDDGTKKEYKK